MNGHCEFHPFERAVDVCNVCFGDLCASCVVALAGRRHPACTKCAIHLSGVRRPGRPVVRGDKSTVKARRERYAEASGGDTYFQFFTTTTDSEADSDAESQGAAPGRERRRGWFRFGRRQSSTFDDGVDEADEFSSESHDDGDLDPLGDGDGARVSTRPGADTRIDRLRRSRHHGGTEHGDSDVTETPASDGERHVGEQPVGPEGRPDLVPARSTIISPTTIPSATTSVDESAPTHGDEPASEPASEPPSLRSLAPRGAATGPGSTDQPIDPGVLDRSTGIDDWDEPERFEPADLSVNPFELAGSRSSEAPVVHNRPEMNRQADHTDTEANHQPNHGHNRPEMDRQADHTDTEGRWIPPALRGADP